MVKRFNLIDAVTVASGLCAITLTGLVGWERLKPKGERDREIANWSEIASAGQVFGSESAAVTIVEFGDYECPACRSFHRIAKSALRAHDGKVRMVYRHWPLPSHARAYEAARAAECAGSQGYFDGFHSWLYEKDWRNANWRTIAEAVGVRDLVAFDQCVSKTEPAAVLERDMAAASALKARGTPALVINGLYLGSTPDSAEFDGIIRRALAR